MSYLKELLGDSFKEGMSEDELSKAIEKAVKAKEKQAEQDLTKIKNAFNKASSEVAEYKHKLQEHLSDEEKKSSEQADLLKQLQEENAAFKRQSAIAENRAKFISFGYGEDLAQKTAEALFDGDLETVFANHKTAWEAKEKEIRAGVMKSTPVPPAGASTANGSVTRESIMQIKDPSERQAQIAEHHDLFGY
jgi:hypothetical protein